MQENTQRSWQFTSGARQHDIFLYKTTNCRYALSLGLNDVLVEGMLAGVHHQSYVIFSILQIR